jgi:hypothetical protein
MKIIIQGRAYEATARVAHDVGCRYTRNGDGWPESWEVEVTALTDYDTTADQLGRYEHDTAFQSAVDDAIIEHTQSYDGGRDHD